MKKTLIAVAAAAALTATSAFAEITFGAWLRSALIPVAYDGEDYLGGLTQSWGGAARTAVLGVNGVSEDGMAGFTFEIRNQAGEDKINHGDRSVLWAKPIDMVKLSVGYFDDGDNGFRQGSGFGVWDWLRPKNTTDLFFNGDDAIIDKKSGDGFMAEILPVDGKDDAVSFLVGVSKGFSNGSLGVGFEGVTNGAGFSSIAAGTDDKGKVHDGFMWCVPVVLTFSF